MAPRGRQHRKVGNTRIDAALDAMRQFGFSEKLVRETVQELLDVYEGTQGWPFIEEASYKLLIETILGKQQSSVEEKKKEDSLQDNTRRDGVTETSSAPTTGITEVGSSGLVAQAHDTASHASDGLDSASQTNDHDSAPLVGNPETDVKDTSVASDRGGHVQDIITRVEYKNEQKPMDNEKGSDHNNTLVSNVEGTSVSARSTKIESSKTTRDNRIPQSRRKPYHGWIDDSDSDVDLICFPLPRLPEHIEKLIGQRQSEREAPQKRRRKSRWDEKPDGM